MQFDSNNSGNIERKELKACLFSLGEELTQSEVEGYVKKFGSGGKLNMAQFRELMVHLIGVIHTKESIVASFQFIGRDDDEVSPALPPLGLPTLSHACRWKSIVLPSASRRNTLTL